MGLDISTIQTVVNGSRASQNKIELRKLLEYVGEINPTIILEIGVHKGYSLEIWNNAFQPKKLIGVENNVKEIDWQAIQNPVNIVEGDSHSDETLKLVKEILVGDAVDFLWLDGDHTYEGVKRDYELYAPLVRHGGVIGFHDIMLDSNEWRMAGVDVQRFWNQVTGRATAKYYTFWDEIGKGTGTGIYYNL